MRPGRTAQSPSANRATWASSSSATAVRAATDPWTSSASTRERDIERYRCEPYVYAQMIAGPDAATPGEAKNSWLTGAAAWTFVSGTQGLLGIVPDYDGLRIDPCIPHGWTSFRVVRRFRGVVYEIEVENPDGVGGGVRSLRVDGEEIDGNVVPVVAGADRVRVDVVLGVPALMAGRR